MPLPWHGSLADTMKAYPNGGKKFRSLLRRKQRQSNSFMVYKAANITLSNHQILFNSESKAAIDPETAKLMKEFSKVPRDDVLTGLPPRRNIEHKIDQQPDSKPSHISIFQLSPTELMATKAYISEHFRKRKIRQSRSPYYVPFLFLWKRKESYEEVLTSALRTVFKSQIMRQYLVKTKCLIELDKQNIFQKMISKLVSIKFIYVLKKLRKRHSKHIWPLQFFGHVHGSS